jgi:hypothetical protein
VSGTNTSHPHLRIIEADRVTADNMELQHLCSCCPAVDSLAFALGKDCGPLECLPCCNLLAHGWAIVGDGDDAVQSCLTSSCTALGTPDRLTQLTACL